MIQKYVDRYMAKLGEMEEFFRKEHPKDYKAIVTKVMELVHEDYEDPNPKVIHEIDDGEYQGTLLFLIAEDAYQPSEYYYVMVSYGSCSGCDTLEAIRSYDGNPPNDEQVKDYMALALHIIQKMKKIGGYYSEIV
jgi:hypothetical protein